MSEEKWAKRFLIKNTGKLKIKKKDLPPCPYCGSEAFLNHDKVGDAFIKTLPEGSFERKVFENYFKNFTAQNPDKDMIDAGYSCGCKAYRPGDGIHPEEMATGLKTRHSAIMWWLRKVDEVDGKQKTSKGNN